MTLRSEPYPSFEQYFLELWNSITVENKVPDRWTRWLCPPARAFEVWCRELLAVYLATPSSEDITKAMLFLQAAYHEQRRGAMPEHRDFPGSSRHVCLYSVY